jgi:hypothetical protein
MAVSASAFALGRRPRAKRDKAPGSADRAPRFLDMLVRLQRADGSWNLDKAFAETIGQKLGDLEKQIPAGGKPADLVRSAFATALALALLEARCAGDAVEWKLLADKARAWLKSLPASVPIAQLEKTSSGWVRLVGARKG